MGRIVSRAESFEKVFKAFEDINFAKYDFNIVKQSVIDYIKLYFPESFHDFVESPLFISIVDLFAYMAELAAYRLDVDAHENFITIARRKQSVLRLAKLISYTLSRNLPARGIAKLSSVTTSNTIFDSAGTNLSNITINWNDINNVNWKEQFILVVNDVLGQKFGSVTPRDRVQVGDILFELYTLNNNPVDNGVITFSAASGGLTVSMEAVPVSLDAFGPYERRPENSSSFSILYGTDGIGDSSDNTGFFVFLKQGVLQKQTATFDGITHNQTLTIDVDNINEIDVWVNNIDPNTERVLNDTETDDFTRSGEWQSTKSLASEIFTATTLRKINKYEIETLENDQIKLVFGDGRLTAVPNGTFDVWFRTSENSDLFIPKASITDQVLSVSYQDDNNLPQTFTFTVSLVGPLANASAAETLEHVRDVAPSIYYTQDRMVNATDYNVFLLQDPSIAKLRTLNRTFAGDSKFASWYTDTDQEHYIGPNVLGNDLVVYFRLIQNIIDVPESITGTVLFNDHIEPLLGSLELFTLITSLAEQAGVTFRPRKTFRSGTPVIPDERELILQAFGEPTEFNPTPPPGVFPLGFTYNVLTDTWSATNPPPGNSLFIANRLGIGWRITTFGQRLNVHSETTSFWHNQDVGDIVNFDEIPEQPDLVTILRANPGEHNRVILQSRDVNLIVAAQEILDSNLPRAGERNIHELRVVPEDLNGDHLSDDPTLTDFFDTDNPDNKHTKLTLLGRVSPPVVATSTVIDGPSFHFVVGSGNCPQPGNVVGTGLQIFAFVTCEAFPEYCNNTLVFPHPCP